jgi:hypothetical protein
VKRLQIVGIAAVALAAAVVGPLTALAGAPDLGNRNAGLVHRCKGGDNKGDICSAQAPNNFCLTDNDCNVFGTTCNVTTNQCDTGCLGATCDFSFVGKAHSATLTAVMDEDVTDSVDNTVKSGRALTVLMEVSNGGKKQILAETYRQPANGDIFIGIWNNAVTEPDFVKESSNDFLFQVPPGTLAEGLRAFFGETGIPIITSVSKKIEVSDNQGNDSCTGAGVPAACCTGTGTGTCDRNAQCLAIGNPFLCCDGAGVGTCNTSELASTLRLKVKLRFVEVP